MTEEEIIGGPVEGHWILDKSWPVIAWKYRIKTRRVFKRGTKYIDGSDWASGVCLTMGKMCRWYNTATREFKTTEQHYMYVDDIVASGEWALFDQPNGEYIAAEGAIDPEGLPYKVRLIRPTEGVVSSDRD